MTWRQFFVHMGIIVLGLLIATGLEQSVEFVHRHHKRQEALEALSKEADENGDLGNKNLTEIRKMQQALNDDVSLLVQHRGKAGPVAGELDYSWMLWSFRTGEWEALRAGGTLELIPDKDLQQFVYMYRTYDGMRTLFETYVKDLNVAASIARRATDKTFSASDTEALISATYLAQGDLNTLDQISEMVALSGHLPSSWRAPGEKKSQGAPQARESEGR